MISPYFGTAVALGAHTSALSVMLPVGEVGLPGMGRPPARAPCTLIVYEPKAAVSFVSCGALACASSTDEPATLVFPGTLATGISIVMGEPHAPPLGAGAVTPLGVVT